jgi:hypothetical protein
MRLVRHEYPHQVGVRPFHRVSSHWGIGCFCLRECAAIHLVVTQAQHLQDL